MSYSIINTVAINDKLTDLSTLTENDEDDGPVVNSCKSPSKSIETPKKDWNLLKIILWVRYVWIPYTGVKTRNQLETICTHLCFTSKLEPTTIDEAFSDEDWIITMQE